MPGDEVSGELVPSLPRRLPDGRDRARALVDGRARALLVVRRLRGGLSDGGSLVPRALGRAARTACSNRRRERRRSDAGLSRGGPCGHHARDGDAVVVPCLGALSAADLIGAAAVGIGRLTLVSAGCETCGERAAGLAAGAALDTASAALSILGRRFAATRRTAPRVAADRPPAASAPALSRRDLFAFVARGARRSAAEGLTSQRRTIADLHGQAAPPASHARLRADLAALSARDTAAAAAPAALPADLPLALLEVEPGCTGCGLCVRYCPHGALAVSDGAPRREAALCTGCGLCVEVCPPDVLELRPVAAGSVAVTPAGVP